MRNSKEEILHHGSLSALKGEFEPRYMRTDYFIFIHKPCNTTAKITHVLLDDQGRIIFNLECIKCGKRDALKTHPHAFIPNRPDKLTEEMRKEIFLLSPKYKKCCRKHEWDDL